MIHSYSFEGSPEPGFRIRTKVAHTFFNLSSAGADGTIMKSMKNWNTSILFIISLLFAGCNTEEIIPVSIQCSTGDATEITTESATLRGTAVVQHANEESGQAFFYYSTTAADSESMKVSGYRVSAGSITAEGGFFSTTLSGLNEGTTYYYMASASIGGVEEHGDIKSFITVSKPKEVSVTSDATDITETTAVLSGYANLTDDLKEPAFGIMWSTNQNPSVENGNGDISIEIDSYNKYFVTARGLKPATNYYYKAFVKDGNFLKVGEVRTFTTLDFSAKATTEEATNVTLYSATLQGELKVESIDNLEKSVWFVYSDTYSSPEEIYNRGTKVSSYLDGSDRFTKDLQSLKRGTKYYYMACARVHERIYQGEVQSFDTNSISASIATESAVNCSVFAATLQGKISIDNNETLSVNAGFYYSKQAKTIDELISTGSYVTAQKGSNNTYTASIQSLDSGTEYYYAFIATVDGQLFKGDVKSFSTISIDASIKTNNANSIGLYTATLNASLTVNNSENLNSTVKFYYSSENLSREELISKGTSVEGNKVNNDYQASISSLKRATKYYCLAIATVGDRTFYGSIISFTTTDIDAVVTTGENTVINPFQVYLYSGIVINNPETLSPSICVVISNSYSDLSSLLEGGSKTTVTGDQTNGYETLITSLEENTKYYYVTVATIDGARFTGSVRSFTTFPVIKSGAVDLGLSVKWRACNLGANTPTEKGEFYCWGITHPIEQKSGRSNWEMIGINKYNTNDHLTQLELSDDAAHVELGGKWRIPTAAEWRELMNKCNLLETSSGLYVSGNGRAIFIPVNGYYYNYDGIHYYWNGISAFYWTSNGNADLSYNSSYSSKYYVEAFHFNPPWMSYNDRSRDALGIRPVEEK